MSCQIVEHNLVPLKIQYIVGLIHKHTKKFNVNSKIQAGLSEKSWSHKVGYDSISHQGWDVF